MGLRQYLGKIFDGKKRSEIYQENSRDLLYFGGILSENNIMSVNRRFVTNEKASIEVYGRRSSVSATMKNLSQTGACLAWGQDGVRLETGDLICMTVVLGDLKKRHKVNAEVVWRRDKETGVNFIGKEELVERFVSKTRAAGSVY